MEDGIARWATARSRLRAWLVAHAELVVLLAALLFAVLGVYYRFRDQALYASTQHLDGAFQTASSLHRLASGEAPGRNFLPYLGLGPLFALFPTFALLGANLTASTVAAWFTVQLCAGATLAISFYLVARPTPAWHAVLPGLGLLLLINLAPEFLPHGILEATDPGNSLRPLRAFAPHLVALMVAVAITRPWTARWRLALLGASCVLISLWSNDYGVPSAAFFGLLALGLALGSAESRKDALGGLALGGGIGLLLGIIAAGGRLDHLLRYNWVDVVRDQWWLFCPWGAPDRVLGAGDVLKLLDTDVLTGLAVVSIAVVRALLTRRVEDAAFALVGATSFFGGVVPSVGGHIERGYFIGFQAWKYVAVIAWCVAGARSFLKREHPRAARRLWQLALGSVLLVAMLFFRERRAAFTGRVALAERDPASFYVPELGGYLGAEWRSYVDAAREARGTPVIEEYWGIWSAVQASHALTSVDSIIHALGGVREDFSAALAGAPPRVITTRASFSDWQSWNVSASWWFYRELLAGYAPINLSPTSIEWHPAPSVPWREYGCVVSSSPPRFMVRGKAALYEVTLRYQLDSGGGRSLLRVRNNINRRDSGYLSIDPNAREFTFPARAGEGQQLDLTVTAAPDRHAQLTLEGCTARLVPFSHPEVLQIPEYLVSGEVTDEHWVRGIGRHFAGFFVKLTPASIQTFAVGRWVHFADGSARRISEARWNAPYLNLMVEGPPLDGERVGFPRRLTVSSGPEPEPDGALNRGVGLRQVSL